MSAHTFGDRDVPYFMWDERLTAGEIRRLLATAPAARRIDLMAKVMRDARVEDVWQFISPADLVRHHDALFARLGWHKGMWEFLYNRWLGHGLLKATTDSDAGPGRVS